MEDVQFDESGPIDMTTRKHTIKSKATENFLGVTVSRAKYYSLILSVVVLISLSVLAVYLLVFNARLQRGPEQIRRYLQVDQRLYRSDYKANPTP